MKTTGRDKVATNLPDGQSEAPPIEATKGNATQSPREVCAAVVEEIVLAPTLKNYMVTMGEFGETVIKAVSDEEALAMAEEWVEDGDWSACEQEEYQYYEVTSDAVHWKRKAVVGGVPEPDCSEDEHEWQSPYELVGGLEENPGVWGMGGAQLRFEAICAHCGTRRTTVTENTQNDIPQRVSYRPADAETLAWVAANTAAMEIVGYEVEFRQVGFDVHGSVRSKGRFHRTFAAALADDQNVGHGSAAQLYIDRDFICALNRFGDFADPDAVEARVRNVFNEETAPEVIVELNSLVSDLEDA